MIGSTLIGNMGEMAVSVHTVDGRAIGDLPCDVVSSVSWGREAVEVSGCEVEVLTQADPDLLESLRPWVHWMTVWDGSTNVWTGPVQKATLGREQTQVSARDTSTLMWRTRCPITKTWAETSPVDIAAQLWQLMLTHHGVNAAPTVLPGLADNSFTFSATADSRMLHQVMDDLVKLGLAWTVAGGRPVLGNFPAAPVAELADCDFLVEIKRLRDGTGTFNDVRVQGQNWAQTATAPLAGLRLQSLISLDDMFGVSNIQRATRQYVQDSASIRDVLVVPASASLHPDAPVTLDDLIPGRVFAVHSQGVSSLMRLDAMQVSSTPEQFDVQVTLVTVTDVGELAQLTGGLS